MTERIGGTGWFSAPDAIFEGAPELRGNDKLVYLYLCRRAGPDGDAWPAIARVARETGLGRNTVKRCLTHLVQCEWLAIQPRHEPQGQTSNLYHLLHSDHPRPTVGHPPGPHRATPRPTVGHKGLPEKDSQLEGTGTGTTATRVHVGIPLGLETEEFRAAWAEWLRWRQVEKRKAVTPTAATRQIAQLAKLGAARAVAAIEHSMANDYTGIFEPTTTRDSHGGRRRRRGPQIMRHE